MAIKFIVDSASDILPEEAQRLDIIHLPMKVLFNSEEYYDAVTLSHREFYEKLASAEVLPTTSQISPSEFADAYEKATANGDTAIVITLSAKLSGTYQSAMLAAQDYEGKVFVVDSETVCLAQRILVLRGIELKEQGLGAEEIVNILNEEKHKIRLFALLDTLEYLKKGGRISPAVAFAGGILGIKPIITVENGEVSLREKARGSKQGNRLLRELTESCGGIDFDKPYNLAYSGLSDEALQAFIKGSDEIFPKKPVPVSTVGCTIGTHVGPGAVAIAFFAR